MPWKHQEKQAAMQHMKGAHLLLGHPRYGTVSGLQGLHLWAHIVRRGVDCILQVLLLCRSEAMYLNLT